MKRIVTNHDERVSFFRGWPIACYQGRAKHDLNVTPCGADWLPVALNIPKDSTGQLSDREISKRVGVANSTLFRNKTYMREKFAYFQEIRQIVRIGQNIGKLRIQKE